MVVNVPRFMIAPLFGGPDLVQWKNFLYYYTPGPPLLFFSGVGAKKASVCQFLGEISTSKASRRRLKIPNAPASYNAGYFCSSL